MNDTRWKMYVTVNADHSPDGSCRPRYIIVEDGRRYDIDRIIHKTKAESHLVLGKGIRYTVEIQGKKTYLFEEENGRWFVEFKLSRDQKQNNRNAP